MLHTTQQIPLTLDDEKSVFLPANAMKPRTWSPFAGPKGNRGIPKRQPKGYVWVKIAERQHKHVVMGKVMYTTEPVMTLMEIPNAYSIRRAKKLASEDKG